MLPEPVVDPLVPAPLRGSRLYADCNWLKCVLRSLTICRSLADVLDEPEVPVVEVPDAESIRSSTFLALSRCFFGEVESLDDCSDCEDDDCEDVVDCAANPKGSISKPVAAIVAVQRRVRLAIEFFLLNSSCAAVGREPGYCRPSVFSLCPA
jgi:hypothetical protein